MIGGKLVIRMPFVTTPKAGSPVLANLVTVEMEGEMEPVAQV